MVFVEEIEDDEVPVKEAKEETPKPQAEPALKRGFLDKVAESGESLYGPEGSPEGVVAPETHKAHQENNMNKNLNEQMNRGAPDNNGIEKPPWYTKEYPKGCQYNAPGCALDALETSTHVNELKKQMTRGSRWEEATAKGVKEIRLSFMSVCDEDMDDLVKLLKGNQDVEELDLSHNNVKDQGVQTLVGALANGAAPNLKELRLYSNEFGSLGETMLTKGLPVFRKKLVVHWKEAPWAHIGKPKDGEGYKAPTAPVAA